MPSYPISENRDSPVCIFQASLPLLILPQTSWNSRVCSKDDSAVDWKNMVKVWNTNLISAVRTQPLPNKQTNNQACLAAEHDGWGPRNDPQKGCYASWATVDPNPYPYHVRQLFLGLTFENFYFFGFSSFARKQHRFIWSPVPLVYPILSSKRQIAVHIFDISDIWLENDLRRYKRKKKNSFVENG